MTQTFVLFLTAGRGYGRFRILYTSWELCLTAVFWMKLSICDVLFFCKYMYLYVTMLGKCLNVKDFSYILTSATSLFSGGGHLRNTADVQRITLRDWAPRHRSDCLVAFSRSVDCFTLKNSVVPPNTWCIAYHDRAMNVSDNERT